MMEFLTQMVIKAMYRLSINKVSRGCWEQRFRRFRNLSINIYTLTAQYLLYPEETIQNLTRFVNNEEEEFLPWAWNIVAWK